MSLHEVKLCAVHLTFIELLYFILITLFIRLLKTFEWGWGGAEETENW